MSILGIHGSVWPSCWWWDFSLDGCFMLVMLVWMESNWICLVGLSYQAELDWMWLIGKSHQVELGWILLVGHEIQESWGWCRDYISFTLVTCFRKAIKEFLVLITLVCFFPKEMHQAQSPECHSDAQVATTIKRRWMELGWMWLVGHELQES